MTAPKKERRARTWRWQDLWCDHATGKLRETLMWSNIGKLAALLAFGHHVYRGTDTDTLWAIVMGVLTAHELMSRWLAQRLGGVQPQQGAVTK